MRILFFLLLLLNSLTLLCQQDSVSKPVVQLNLFADVFYAYDFSRPSTSFRQPFLYNHNRHNEFNLNLGLIQFTITHRKLQGKLGIQCGTYVNDNYASELGVLKLISEANLGLAFGKADEFKIEVGIMPSHIGFESALSTENQTLSRSLLAENSPYYMTGGRFNYTPNSNWKFALLVLNGWQRIQRISGSSLPGFGSQLSYQKESGLLISWNTFAGTIDPDSTRRMRYFSNLYSQFKLSMRVKMTLGFDFGLQETQKNSGVYYSWYSPVIIGSVKLADQWSMACRLEYYDDPFNLLISAPYPFKTFGSSLNIDFTPTTLVQCRLEGRYLNAQDPLFIEGKNAIFYNWSLMASLAFYLKDFELGK